MKLKTTNRGFSFSNWSSCAEIGGFVTVVTAKAFLMKLVGNYHYNTNKVGYECYTSDNPKVPPIKLLLLMETASNTVNGFRIQYKMAYSSTMTHLARWFEENY